MSFLNIFKKRNKSEEKKDEELEAKESELKDRRLKKQLSISRSGRYKAKARQRGAVADRPELFNQDTHPSGQEGRRNSSGQSQSPNNSCREVNGRVIPGGMRLNEQMAS